jgi:hypothetical protein
MLKRFFEMLREHSKDVFGAAPHTALSIYSLLAIASVVVPILVLLIAVLLKIM